ncbi:MAG: hypothetical protein CME71_04895 [Halobacteriovorax sp.]|nr:hypothetical protein [Halobacteriovorax sp.]
MPLVPHLSKFYDESMRIYLTFSLLFFCLNTQAALFIEPLVLTRVAGDTKHQAQNYGTDKTNYGSRFGFMSGGSFIAAEAMGSSWTITSPDKSTKEDFSGLSAGITVGHQIAFLRIFGSYYFINSMTSDLDNSKLDGSGFVVGLSLGGINYLNLVFSYEISHYKERTTASGIVTDLGGDLAIKPQIFLLGLSYPLTF